MWLVLPAVALGATACDEATEADEEAVFRVQACTPPQSFHVRIVDPLLIAHAEALVGSAHIVAGDLVRGSGGFNQPWSWHLDPVSISFPEVTIELCDGCPQMVEDDLDYWVDVVGRYCPWSSRVVERVE